MARLSNFPAGPAYALAAFAVFATHDVIVKVLGATYAPFQIVFFSVLFGFPLATFMLMRDPTSGHLRPVHPWWTALRTGAAVITGSSAFYAFSTLPLAQVYSIIFASPLIITVLSIPILGETVGRHRWAAVFAGLIGVFTVLRPFGDSDLSLGHLAAVIAAIGSATTSVVVRRIGRDERGVVLLLYPMVANFVLMGLILPFVYKPMPMLHLGLTAVIAAFAFVAGLLMIAAYRRGDAATVAPMQYSQIIWAALFGLLFFDERPDGMTILGAAIIIASGLYIVIRESMLGAASAAPVTRTRSRHGTGTEPRIGALLRRRSDRMPAGYEALAKDPPK